MAAISSQISAFAAVVLGLVGAFFFVRILVLVFVGQIDLMTGRPGALADLAEQVIFLLLTLLLAVNAQAIGRAFAGLAQGNKDALLSGDITRLSVLITPTAGMLVRLAADLVIAFTLMGVVFIALKSQFATLVSSSEGLSRSILQVTTAFLILGLGILALLVGQSLMH